MNLEQLCRTIRENYSRLRSERAALLFLRYQFELLAWKRGKLKLGAVVFEFKELIYAGITITQTMEMRYIRQDTTREDELKPERRLKALGWRSDFKNIFALIVVVWFICWFLFTQIRIFLYRELPWLFLDRRDFLSLFKQSARFSNLVIEDSAVPSIYICNELLIDRVICAATTDARELWR